MSDRCYPHGARACRRCETTPGEHLDAETLQAWRVIYTHMLAGQHVDPVEGDRILVLITEVERLRSALSLEKSAHDLTGQHATDLDDALAAERAAHATTKAELDEWQAWGNRMLALLAGVGDD